MSKSPEPNSKNEPHDELRQQLWELSYGLLEDDAAAALRMQIKSDPAIARLYAEVRLQADLVSRAARVEDSALQISAGPAAKSSKSGSRAVAKTSSGKSWHAAEQQSWGTNWLAVGGTVALLVLLAFGLYQPQAVTNSVAQADYFFTQITAPTNTPEGVTQTVEINTTDVHNNGRSAELALRLVDREGRETFRKEFKTSDNGHASVELPGSALKPGVTLEAIPQEEGLNDRTAAVVSAPLQVTEEKKRQLLLLEKPSAKAGETVGFSLLKIGENSKQLAAPETDELMIENQAGVDVVQPTWETDRQAGVIRGQFALPQNSAIESEQLAIRRRSLQHDQLAKSEDGRDAARKSDKLTERQALPLERAGARSENGTRSENRSLANGAMAGGRALEGSAASDADFNRLPRAAAEQKRAPLAKAAIPGDGEGGAADNQRAVPLPGLARGGVQEAPSPPPAPAAPAKPAAAPGAPTPPHEAIASAAPTQQNADRKNIEKALVDDGQANNAAAPLAASGKAGMLKAQQGGGGVMARGFGTTKDAPNLPAEGNDKPVQDAPTVEAAANNLAAALAQPTELPTELHVPADLQDQDLILFARRNGEVIARRELGAGKKFSEVDLPPEVDGRVEIELFRKGATNEPAYRQELIRTAVRALRFDVDGLKDSYAPGEKVKLQVRVVDEKGEPAAAAVGVRVWNDVAAAATNAPLLLVDTLARESEVSNRKLDTALAMAAPQDAHLREAAKRSELAAPGAAAAPQNAPAPAAEVALAPAQAQRQMKRMADSEKDKSPEPQIEGEAGAPSEAKLDTFGAPPAAEVYFNAPQVVADNRAIVQQEYDAAVAAAQGEHFARIRAIGRVLVWAGAGLMLLIGLLLIARSQLKTVVWLPAVGVAAVCLALGMAWFVPPQPVGWQLARLEENSGSAFATDSEATQLAEPPSEAISPTPPGAPAGADLVTESQKEVAQREPVIQPPTDEKMKFQQPPLLRAAQPLVDVKPADAAVDKPQAKKSAERELLERRSLGGGGSVGEVAPDTLFWRPLSLVGSDGLFTIEFNMPTAESDYRLLLDAIGNGRIGGHQQLLICREK